MFHMEQLQDSHVLKESLTCFNAIFTKFLGYIAPDIFTYTAIRKYVIR